MKIHINKFLSIIINDKNLFFTLLFFFIYNIHSLILLSKKFLEMLDS